MSTEQQLKRSFIYPLRLHEVVVCFAMGAKPTPPSAHAGTDAAGINQLPIGGVVAKQERAEMRPGALRISPADVGFRVDAGLSRFRLYPQRSPVR